MEVRETLDKDNAGPLNMGCKCSSVHISVEILKIALKKTKKLEQPDFLIYFFSLFY